MKSFQGKTLRWEWREGGIELALDHEPANEIGTAMLEELEVFVGAFGALAPEISSCIIHSARKSVFSAGGDLRELYHQAISVPEKERPKAIRSFLGRIHAVMNALDAAPFVTIAAVYGPRPGGGVQVAPARGKINSPKKGGLLVP